MKARAVIFSVLANLALGLVLSGCSTTRPVLPADTQADAASPSQRPEIGRAELWAQRCSQCHYARSADTFSTAQWEIIMLHMRIRANLLPDEHQAILEFLSGR